MPILTGIALLNPWEDIVSLPLQEPLNQATVVLMCHRQIEVLLAAFLSQGGKEAVREEIYLRRKFTVA